MPEDWPVLLSFFPSIRTLLIHVACGYSLRETAARAKTAQLADISDVALIGRLKKAKDWLHRLCVELFEQKGIVSGNGDEFQVRLFEATNVKEPGKTGSLWRIHYSVQVPSLTCDFFKLTATKGMGTGESFFQYAIKKGDHIIADRGYSTASRIHHVASKKAYVLVRVNTQSLPLLKMQVVTSDKSFFQSAGILDIDALLID